MNQRTIILGYMAPPLKEQHPELHADDADRFDEDSAAISRLKMRGLLAPSLADKARSRLVKNIENALTRALNI